MFYQLTIPFLTFFAVTAIGGAVLVARAARMASIRRRLHGFEGSVTAPKANEKKTTLLTLLGRLGNVVAPRGPSPALRKDLAKAGYFGRSAGGIYLAAKAILFLIGLVGISAAVVTIEMSVSVKILLIVGGASVLFLVPNFVVTMHRQKRATAIRNHLPDAVDLLEICVTSGMGLDMAWNAVADEIRSSSAILADEMALTNLESHLGAPRASAMRNMADRTGADELASLAALLIQSERFGTSISDALSAFATTMRDTRRQRAEEAAEKMAVRLLFPLVVFIFPTILIVTAGPAGIKIASIFGDG